MAAQNCFQMSSSLSSPTIPFLSSHNSLLHSKDKLSLPARTSPSPKAQLFFPPPSISPHSLPTLRRRSLLCRSAGNKAVTEVQDLTEASWKALVIGSETPVLVDFWAPWCGPCRIIAPIIDELAKEYAGKITCFKVNTDECPNIASQYGIRSIPTVLFFKQGEKKESVIGAVPKSILSATIDKYIDS